MFRELTAYTAVLAIGLMAAISATSAIGVPAFAGNERRPPMARYLDCPPVDVRGWPRIQFSFPTFRSRAETERALLEHVRCFASMSAIQDWLVSNGFQSVREYKNKHSDGRYQIAGSRSVDAYGAVYGGPISRLWQKLIVFKTSVAVYFDVERRAVSVKITDIIQ